MLALGPDRPQLSNAPRRSSGRAAICVNAPVADGRDDNQRSERHGRLLSSPGGPRVDAARGNRRVADAVAPPSAAAAVTAACEALAQRARCRPKQRPTRRCATSKQQPAEEVRRASSPRRKDDTLIATRLLCCQRGSDLTVGTGAERGCCRTSAATCSRWLIRLLPPGRRCRCSLDAGSRELTSTAALDGSCLGLDCSFVAKQRVGAAGGARDWRPAREASLPAQSSSPALTCIIGARRAWIALMISSVLIPWRYTLVVETYEWPSWR